MGAGVGLFLGLIGLKTAGIVVDSPATLIKLGSLREPGPLLAAICFLMIAILSYHKVFGAILISIITVTLAGWGLGWCTTKESCRPRRAWRRPGWQ
jgi:AGZA family xanthine/uracil permease-like MFS transporter